MAYVFQLHLYTEYGMAQCILIPYAITTHCQTQLRNYILFCVVLNAQRGVAWREITHNIVVLKCINLFCKQDCGMLFTMRLSKSCNYVVSDMGLIVILI